ncbi:serine/threonine protein kinase [Mucilaginibacter pallidiroseus]|uniref:Serine/threonine protein kinase n=1 Tax=Mucilaginibacter pallidiroseus TaxID=2599295 RepID=A0A563UC42_9SPHI|nr:serine/threonine-protein kinase [Mucilaginibacter pallidiroseus]TWR28948.1 serine/threonine protein kinase [Mucilaginibacter pallidiroseus]
MSKVFTITEGLENLGALRSGGQGSVYKGRRMGPIISAVKLLPTPIYSESDEDKNYRAFSNEVAKMRMVNEVANPNIVKFLSSGITESGSLPYIEMEYVEGPDLCDLLQPPHERIFMLQEVIRVAYQLSNALAHCHKLGIKHGDIKSNNVKYNINTGNYVLLDFGLAILTDEARRTSIRNAGAIEFMAPEQHDGTMLEQTDVYSFGVIMYELLTGQVPFPLEGHTETARNTVMIAHMEKPVPDLMVARHAALPITWSDEKQHLEMQVPFWLLSVINKCLQKKPGERYASGIELQEAIVAGSLNGERQGQQDVLLSENERLQAEVKSQQEAIRVNEDQLAGLKAYALETGAKKNPATGRYERNPKLAIIPKKVLTFTVAGLLIFAVLFAYAIFTKPTYTPGGPLLKNSVFAKPPFINRAYDEAAVAKTVEELEVAKMMRRKRRADSLAAAKTDSPQTKRWSAPKKKKRKKFLGIF